MARVVGIVKNPFLCMEVVFLYHCAILVTILGLALTILILGSAISGGKIGPLDLALYIKKFWFLVTNFKRKSSPIIGVNLTIYRERSCTVGCMK